MIKGKEVVKRSKKVVFVSFCILSQSVRAKGVSIRFSAVVDPIVKLLMENNVNIVQMPCPELCYEGVLREAVRKDSYDNPEFRSICKEHANETIKTLHTMLKGGFQIIGILGVENSPTCGVNFVFRDGKGRVRESGIFIEELQQLLMPLEIKSIPIIGIQVYNIKNSMSELKNLISKQARLADFTVDSRKAECW